MNANHDNDKVIDHTRQQLSALFDGELGLDEARFLQRRLQHDVELLAGWSRWQLAGDVLRGQAVAAAPAGFAERVAAAVAAEAAPVAAPVGRRGRWLPGAALAASVAALAMFMTRQAPEVNVPAAPIVEIASAADTLPAAPRAPAAPAPAVPAAPSAPSAPDTALQVAGTAIAVTEVPRRAAERRSRAQQQRAASTRVQRNAPESRLVAAASSSSPAAFAPDQAPANPFLPEAAAEVVTARPWPRALLPSAGGAFTVGYGRLQAGVADARPAHPFQPRPLDLSRTDHEDTD
jgi:negative regulator of sigma E activity